MVLKLWEIAKLPNGKSPVGKTTASKFNTSHQNVDLYFTNHNHLHRRIARKSLRGAVSGIWGGAPNC